MIVYVRANKLGKVDSSFVIKRVMETGFFVDGRDRLTVRHHSPSVKGRGVASKGREGHTWDWRGTKRKLFSMLSLNTIVTTSRRCILPNFNHHYNRLRGSVSSCNSTVPSNFSTKRQIQKHPLSDMADALDHMASGRTRLEWLTNLNTEFQPKKNYRRTSIICTIGQDTFSNNSPSLW